MDGKTKIPTLTSERVFGKDKSREHGKPRNTVFVTIIASLLENESLTKGDLADKCGYREKTKDKYAYITRQMSHLESTKGYLETIPVKSNPTICLIKRDLQVIRELYEDPVYIGIRDKFRESPWLQDFLLETSVQSYLVDDETRDDARRMLRVSSLFFEWALYEKGEVSVETPVTQFPPVTNRVLLRTPEHKRAMAKCALYDLFTTCMIAENYDLSQSGTLSEEKNFIMGEITGKSTRIKWDLASFDTSLTLMRSLAVCLTAVKGTDKTLPPDLEEFLKDYRKFGRVFSKESPESEQFAQAEREAAVCYETLSKKVGMASGFLEKFISYDESQMGKITTGQILMNLVSIFWSKSPEKS